MRIIVCVCNNNLIINAISVTFQAEKECSEFSFQLESLSERLDEADGLSSAQVGLSINLSLYNV